METRKRINTGLSSVKRYYRSSTTSLFPTNLLLFDRSRSSPFFFSFISTTLYFPFPFPSPYTSTFPFFSSNMLLYSAVSLLLSLGLAAQALPVGKMGAVELAKRTGSGSSGELISPPTPPSSDTHDICKVIDPHDPKKEKEVTIRGHLAKGGSQRQAWIVTAAPGFPANAKYFAKTSLTKTEFDATMTMGLVVAHSKKGDCAMMHFLGEDITSLQSYQKAYGTSVEACNKWVDDKFKHVEEQIEGMRGALGEAARHADLHPWNTRWMSETQLKIIDFGMLHHNGGKDVDKEMKEQWKKMLCNGAGPGAKPNKEVLHSSGGLSDGDFVHVKLSTSTSSFEVVDKPASHGSHGQAH
ncbi:hypothetical protein FRB91_006121 [Serendipita sp. 411]|nr:hypothetical protein FRC18_002252 [Serendipita sp. 400]KAG8852714.1 hypothetical protein FRB91_006121 [Serendipita sp. 411]